MQKISTTLILSFVLLFVAGTVSSQEYRTSNFGINEGLLHSFVYTINQDNRGYIWVGTGEGLCRFNGFTFSKDFILDSLAGEVAGVSYKDTRGVLWFGYHSGSIANYDGRSFNMLTTGLEINSAVTGFAELKDGLILVSTLNNGCFTFNVSSGQAIATEGIDTGIYTALLVKGNIMLLGSQVGLSIYSIDNDGSKASLKVKIKEFEFVKIQDIQASSVNNVYWIATEDQGVSRAHPEWWKISALQNRRTV